MLRLVLAWAAAAAWALTPRRCAPPPLYHWFSLGWYLQPPATTSLTSHECKPPAPPLLQVLASHQALRSRDLAAGGRGRVALDACCGCGGNVIQMAAGVFPVVYGVEISERRVEMARHNAGAWRTTAQEDRLTACWRGRGRGCWQGYLATFMEDLKVKGLEGEGQ